jgi:hemoglobin-like flavoprotein
VAYGVQPEHYPVVGSALISAMAVIAGEAWRSEYEVAWAEAFEIVAATMIDGAESAALEVAA